MNIFEPKHAIWLEEMPFWASVTIPAGFDQPISQQDGTSGNPSGI